MVTALSQASIAQTNLILNPGFESGSIPTNVSGISTNTATYWTEYGFPYFYTNGDPNPSTNACVKGTSDVLDKRSSNCLVGIPKNDWGNLNERTTGNRYVSFSGGGWQIVPASNPHKYRFFYGETISGSMSSYVQYGCSYTVSFWAANATKSNNNCGSFPNNLPSVGNYNKIEVVLRKSSTSIANCNDYIVVWTSPNITSTSWTQFTGTFSISYADFLKGYDKIDFRFTPFPESEKSLAGNRSRRIFLDDVSLTTTTYTATSGYSFNNLNVNTPTTWNNVSVELQGTTTLNSNLTISGNAKVRLGDNAKIVVKSGKKLTITSSTVEGMCNMWDKIEVENGGEISISGSNIYDMRNGVRVNGGSSKYTITTSNFDRNYVSVYLFQTNMVSTSSSIAGNIFRATQALKDKSLTKSGYGEYGARVVKCAGKTSFGTSSGGGNTFIGSTYGIWIEDSETDLYYNTFDSQKEVGIMCFNGFIFNKKYYMLGANKGLTVSGNFIRKNKTGIEIKGRTDNCKIIDQNKFEKNSDYGIKISQARGTQSLAIGTNNAFSSIQNTFDNNGIAGIYLYDNGGYVKSGNIILGTTDIIIGVNKFSNSINASGILIQEPTKGSNKIFKQLNILNNIFFDIGTAISYSNIIGNNGDVNTLLANQLPAIDNSSLIDTRILSNSIYYISQKNPVIVGIKDKNTWGVQILKNGVNNTTTQQWQNKAIWADFAENTLIRENQCYGSGYGLNAGGVALNSNYHCNVFDKYNTGIHLNFHTLRNVNNTHGLISGSTSRSRNNNYNNIFSWSTGIHVYNSSTNRNNWIFETGKALPNILYTGVSGSIVNPNRGNDACQNISFLPPYDPNNGTSGGTSPIDVFTDAYRIESYYVNNDTLLIGSHSLTVSKLIAVENYYRDGLYSSANSTLATVTPSSLLDSNYKLVLEELLKTKPADTATIPVDSIGIVRLSYVASQNVQNGGPAVYLARAILKYEQNLEFDDEDYKIPTLTGQLVNLNPCTDSLDAIPLALIDNMGNLAPIPPIYTSLGGKFALDPMALTRIDSTKLYGFMVPYPSNYSVINTEFKSLADWSLESSISIEVDEIIPSITSDPISGYTSSLVATDVNGNVYSASTISTAVSTDIRLIKYNSIGTSLWSRYYRGWAGLADSAFMVSIDTMGYIYVGGSTQDSSTNNALVLKYNSLGGLELAQIFKDSLGSNTKPTGVKIGTAGQIYTRMKKGSETIYITYQPCSQMVIPFNGPEVSEGLAIINNTESIANNSLEKPLVYPNPNNGTLNIIMNSSSPSAVMRIYSLSGVEVQSFSIDATSKSFYIGGLNNGLYIYTIVDSNSGNIHRGKLILNK